MRREPARGVLAGIKQDVKAAALQASSEYSAAPVGVGTAFSHNFLNQKPWHPLNFRNQARVYEREQQAAKEAKDRAVAKAEYEAEQDYVATLSCLSTEDRQRQVQRSQVSWMYQKPAGLDAANKRVEEGPGEAPGGPAADAGGPSRPAGKQAGRSYVTDMLGAVTALHASDDLILKHGPGGRSPPRGRVDPQAHNQQFVAAESECGWPPPAQKGARKRHREELQEAEAVLRRAGILPEGKDRKGKKQKRKKAKREK